MSENPFSKADAWSVSDSDSILTAGDHAVEVVEIDGGGTSSGGYPQVEVRVGNADGQIRDWIVVIPSTIGKVVQLTDAAGLERPSDDQVTADGPGYRLEPRYLDQLVGKKVGVIVRQEPDRQDPTRMRDRVKGYVPVDQLHADVSSDASSFTQPPLADDDIPF